MYVNYTTVVCHENGTYCNLSYNYVESNVPKKSITASSQLLQNNNNVVFPDMVMDFFLLEDLLHCQRFNLC